MRPDTGTDVVAGNASATADALLRSCVNEIAMPAHQWELSYEWPAG